MPQPSWPVELSKPAACASRLFIVPPAAPLIASLLAFKSFLRFLLLFLACLPLDSFGSTSFLRATRRFLL